IGGAEIYRQMMPLADRLCLTVIDAEVSDADTSFPAIDLDRYCVEEVVPQNTEPRCSFITLRRVRK
ncbi:MAG: dihydrofolate reductase, partial [Muribaculaceae bacterium]|nr:dihydrofolate reductase [Muribaculaceae bacterium]